MFRSNEATKQRPLATRVRRIGGCGVHEPLFGNRLLRNMSEFMIGRSQRLVSSHAMTGGKSRIMPRTIVVY